MAIVRIKDRETKVEKDLEDKSYKDKMAKATGAGFYCNTAGYWYSNLVGEKEIRDKVLRKRRNG